ncbi:MAG: S41 family peptidase [Candidatus Kapabacteria bacterium]|nr:S41 family peptidase [Candidatus Kapabacteria bacterium]
MRSNLKFLFVIVVCCFFIIGTNDREYFKINKSFDIFGSVFKEISNNYIFDIEPDDLMNAGIDGMLQSLDPYTEFYEENETDDIDFITNGSYTGFGIMVSLIDSNLTITGVHDGYSAQKCGLRIGDKIIQVDTSILTNKTNKDLRDFTRGVPGTKAKVYIKRDGIDSLLIINLEREIVNLGSVTYSGMLENWIGYIKLERFNRSTISEFQSALNNLKRNNKLNGLVIDLRDNSGGVLDAAISICGMFIPVGEKIVETKGKISNAYRVFNSINPPQEPNLPLAVLIDENSASASEVVAGCLQDLDRAVIIGKRSFGKGLVQSIVELPYKSEMKMTTAKYYTPSGRCIQKNEQFGKLYKKTRPNSTKINDSVVFFTKNKRIVYELNGIEPDTSTGKKNIPQLLDELSNRFVIFKFVNYLTGKLKSQADLTLTDEEILSKFKKSFIAYKTPANELLKKLYKMAQDEKFHEKALSGLKDMERIVANEEWNYLMESKADLMKLIRSEINQRFFNQKKQLEENLLDDEDVRIAEDLISSQQWKKILKREN